MFMDAMEYIDAGIDILEENYTVTPEERVDEYSQTLEHRHIDRVKTGNCTAQAGSIFLQTVSNLERVGDHITNVAFSIRQYRFQKSA